MKAFSLIIFCLIFLSKIVNGDVSAKTDVNIPIKRNISILDYRRFIISWRENSKDFTSDVISHLKDKHGEVMYELVSSTYSTEEKFLDIVYFEISKTAMDIKNDTPMSSWYETKAMIYDSKAKNIDANMIEIIASSGKETYQIALSFHQARAKNYRVMDEKMTPWQKIIDHLDRWFLQHLNIMENMPEMYNDFIIANNSRFSDFIYEKLNDDNLAEINNEKKNIIFNKN